MFEIFTLNAVVASVVYGAAGAAFMVGLAGLLWTIWGTKCPKCQSLKIVQISYHKNMFDRRDINFCHKCGTIL